MKKVTKVQFIDHGIENFQFFQGCGVAYTEFENVATGIGDTYREALEDAAEQLAVMGYEGDLLSDEVLDKEAGDDEESVFDYIEEEEDFFEESELFYYASIRVK